jgi:hypothetical protein
VQSAAEAFNFVASTADGTGIDDTASAEGATYTPPLSVALTPKPRPQANVSRNASKRVVTAGVRRDKTGAIPSPRDWAVRRPAREFSDKGDQRID